MEVFQVDEKDQARGEYNRYYTDHIVTFTVIDLDMMEVVEHLRKIRVPAFDLLVSLGALVEHLKATVGQEDAEKAVAWAAFLNEDVEAMAREQQQQRMMLPDFLDVQVVGRRMR